MIGYFVFLLGLLFSVIHFYAEEFFIEDSDDVHCRYKYPMSIDIVALIGGLILIYYGNIYKIYPVIFVGSSMIWIHAIQFTMRKIVAKCSTE